MGKTKDTLRQAFCHGFVDRAEHGLLRREQLYRATWAHELCWLLGWSVANALTSYPLRTSKTRPKLGPWRCEPREDYAPAEPTP